MKFNALIGSNMTGKLGGIVASHNTYGPYFRKLVIPVNRNTTGQQAQRRAFATMSQTWRALELAQQNAWGLAAPQNTVPNSTGGSLTLSGQALFMRMNVLRQRIGLPIVTNAPTSTEVPTITLPTVVLNLDGSLTITFDAGDEWNALNGGIIVSASPLLSSGRNFNSQYTDVGTIGFPGEDPQAFLLPYSTVAGGRITLRYRSTTPDGRLSDLTYQDITAPQQAVVQSFFVNGATTAHVQFSRNIDAADFAAGDFTGPWQTTVTAVAQDQPNTLILTGTVFHSPSTFILTPSGAAAAYTPVQTGPVVP